MMSIERCAGNKLKELCPVDLQLVWHENKSSFLSYLKKDGLLHLRLHRLFATAPSPVLEALCRYVLTGDRQSGAIVRRMAHFYFSHVRAAPDSLVSKGCVYDLQEIAQRIETRYFVQKVEVSIGWSDARRIGKFRCITFGSYDRHRNQIRIHPLLDDAAVPLYFLEFIVYHEMLHAVCPARMDMRGATRSHTPEFRRLERKFADFDAAKEWEKKSLQFLKQRVKSHGRT